MSLARRIQLRLAALVAVMVVCTVVAGMACVHHFAQSGPAFGGDGTSSGAAGQRMQEVIRSLVVYGGAALVVGLVIAWLMGRATVREVDGVADRLSRQVAEHELAAARLRRNEMRLAALVECASLLDRSLRDMTTFVVDRAVALTDSDLGFIGFIDHEANTLVVHAWSEGVMKSCDVAPHRRYFPLSTGSLVTAPGVTGEPIIRNHYAEAHTGVLPDGHLPISRALIVPIKSRGECVGVAGVANKASDYDASDVEQLRLLVDGLWSQVEHKRLSDEHRRLATAVEQAAETIVITDMDGNIEYVNPAFERITGYTRAEALGANPRMLKSGLQPDAFYKRLWEVITGGETWTGQFINKRKDGRLYREEATISPVKDASGAITNYVAVKRDVTHQHALETQLRQAQKMEAIGTLAGGIAHDFNNMLAAIIGFADMTLDDVPEGSLAHGNINEIIRAGTRARDLVQQILAFSRQTESEQRPVEAHLIIREALQLLRASLPATIEIRQRIDARAGAVLCDPSHIHQTIMNLCTNAYHAMRDSGGVLDVTLEAVYVEEERVESFGTLRPGHYVCLTVADTGHGMDRATMERAFEPFFTTKAVNEGTGMGLSAVHGYVTALGGAITVDSRPGAGATFRVYLPRTELIGAIERPTEAAPMDFAGTERVMVIDDEGAVLMVVSQMLERLGYAVVAFRDPRAAVEAFRQAPQDVDIIITDQVMPHITGAEVARQVRAARADMPLVMMTGFGDVITPEEAAALGFRQFLTKPILAREMGQAVRRALD